MNANDALGENSGSNSQEGTRRENVRLTTVFGGRICQFGKAYACVRSEERRVVEEWSAPR